MRVGPAFFAALLTALAVDAAAAQQGRSQVTIQARLTIPDVLLLAEAGRVDTVDAAGNATTRTTVHIKANRGWALGLTPADVAAIEELRVNGTAVDPRSALAQGRNTNDHQVVLEIKWKAGTSTADPRRLQYALSAS